MQIREGSYYITRSGDLVGPMEEQIEGDAVWYSPGTGLYREDGTFGFDNLMCEPFDITDTVDNAARRCIEGA